MLNITRSVRIIALAFLLSASVLRAQDSPERTCGNEYASVGAVKSLVEATKKIVAAG